MTIGELLSRLYSVASTIPVNDLQKEVKLVDTWTGHEYSLDDITTDQNNVSLTFSTHEQGA